MRNRAFRREQTALKKREAVKRLKNIYLADVTPRSVGMAACTPKACSCFLCGNPRKYYGDSKISEQRWQH